MRALRTAALVMLGIAAVDGILDGVEYLIARLTDGSAVNVWPILLCIGLAVLVVDLLIEHRTSVGKCCRETGAWIQSKLGRSSGS